MYNSIINLNMFNIFYILSGARPSSEARHPRPPTPDAYWTQLTTNISQPPAPTPPSSTHPHIYPHIPTPSLQPLHPAPNMKAAVATPCTTSSSPPAQIFTSGSAADSLHVHSTQVLDPG